MNNTYFVLFYIFRKERANNVLAISRCVVWVKQVESVANLLYKDDVRTMKGRHRTERSIKK